MSTSKQLVSVDFEIFGLVQDVFFRKYTKDTARRLGLVGWVRNTDGGTVDGIVQGQQSKVAEMKEWLSTTGSPESRIDKAEFKNERVIPEPEFEKFKAHY